MASEYSKWAVADRLTFAKGPGGLIRMEIQTPQAVAHVYLHGAHVTHFQPAATQPVLFLSKESSFQNGKPIRGGIPLIFPWFGPRTGNPESPMHGFARTRNWNIEAVECGEDTLRVTLTLSSTPETLQLWPYDFRLRYRIEVGSSLALALEVENLSEAAWQFEDALHTYFQVSSVHAVKVTGLENTVYIDKTDAFARKTEGPQPITITAETDRIYLNTTTTCVLEDPGFGRQILVEKQGSSTTVLWNPWEAKAKVLADLGEDEWPDMVCIETANASDNAILLHPGQSHTTSVRLSVRL